MAPIPKVTVDLGQSVQAGEPIVFGKTKPHIQHRTPVSGEVIEVNRAAKRAIAEIVILADGEMQYKELHAPGLESATREQIVQFLLASGGWPLLTQRPFDIVPPIDSEPANIFISTFDSAPLAHFLPWLI